MDHLDRLRCFVAIAEVQSFAAAARRLGVSPPAATRAIAALEQRLGAQLFQRSTRAVRLTEAGERFLEDCRRILTELDESEASVRGAAAEPRGWLSVTAPAMFGRLHVAPLVTAILQQHPLLRLKLLLVDRVVSLLDEAQDLAVRIAPLPDLSLTAVPVGSMRRMIVASPAYLEKAGEPTGPEQLLSHRTIGVFFDRDSMTPWRFHDRTVQPQPCLLVNDTSASVAAAAAGLGLARCLAYQAAEALHEGRLRVVLRDYELPPVPVHLVHAVGRRVPAKLRLLLDFMTARLREEPVLRGEAFGG